MVLAGLTVTGPRSEVVDFSYTFFEEESGIAIKV